MTRASGFAALAAAALGMATLAVGCGVEDPYPPFRIDGGARTDGAYWPDYGPLPKYDYGITPYFDTGSTIPQDGQPPAGDASADGSSAGCQTPTGVSCATCAPGMICTPAKGGACTKTVVLTGPASDPDVLKAVANAYVACWDQQPAEDTLCSTFDTCQMTGTLTDPMVCDWVCDYSQVGDFPNVTKHDTAKMICGCAIYQKPYRPDWQISSIIAGQQGIDCLSYDVDGDMLYFDYLVVDTCSKYPPK